MQDTGLYMVRTQHSQQAVIHMASRVPLHCLHGQCVPTTLSTWPRMYLLACGQDSRSAFAGKPARSYEYHLCLLPILSLHGVHCIWLLHRATGTHPSSMASRQSR